MSVVRDEINGFDSGTPNIWGLGRLKWDGQSGGKKLRDIRILEIKNEVIVSYVSCCWYTTDLGVSYWGELHMA